MAAVSGSAIYRTFTGQAEILAELLNSALDVLTAAITPRGPQPIQNLEAALRHHIHFSISNRPLVRLYQQEARTLADPWKNSFDARRREYINKWILLIGNCFPQQVPIQTEQQVDRKSVV